MELCCALHTFRVRLTPWPPMLESGYTQGIHQAYAWRSTITALIRGGCSDSGLTITCHHTAPPWYGPVCQVVWEEGAVRLLLIPIGRTPGDAGVERGLTRLRSAPSTSPETCNSTQKSPPWSDRANRWLASVWHNVTVVDGEVLA
jgi:hypothetical protein